LPSTQPTIGEKRGKKRGGKGKEKKKAILGCCVRMPQIPSPWNRVGGRGGGGGGGGGRVAFLGSFLAGFLRGEKVNFTCLVCLVEKN